MPQFEILATRKDGADVAEGFLLAVVTRLAHSIFLMISSSKKSCMFLRFRLPAPFSCHPMSSQIVIS